MAIYSGFPLNGTWDWDFDGFTVDDSSVEIAMWKDYGSITVIDGYVNLNTSAVTTGGPITISAATLTFWNNSVFNGGGLVTYIYMWDGSGYNVQAYERTSGPGANRYVTTALTTSAQLACINASAGTITSLKFYVSESTSEANPNTWGIQSYDGSSTGCTRIGIRYDPAVATSTRRRPFIIC